MNVVEAWAITIALCLVILATPLRVINLLLFSLIAGPLALVALLVFI